MKISLRSSFSRLDVLVSGLLLSVRVPDRLPGLQREVLNLALEQVRLSKYPRQTDIIHAMLEGGGEYLVVDSVCLHLQALLVESLVHLTLTLPLALSVVPGRGRDAGDVRVRLQQSHAGQVPVALTLTLTLTLAGSWKGGRCRGRGQMDGHRDMRRDVHLEAPVVHTAIRLEIDHELGAGDEQGRAIAHSRPVHRGSVRPGQGTEKDGLR